MNEALRYVRNAWCDDQEILAWCQQGHKLDWRPWAPGAMGLTQWMTCELAVSLGLGLEQWGDNAAMAKRAEEILSNDPERPVLYVRIQHAARKNAQEDIRAGVAIEGISGGLNAIRERRARSGPPRAAPAAAAPRVRLRSRSLTRSGCSEMPHQGVALHEGPKGVGARARAPSARVVWGRTTVLPQSLVAR
eukprot:4329236-Alexandrium_andersonii.AAC.1